MCNPTGRNETDIEIPSNLAIPRDQYLNIRAEMVRNGVTNRQIAKEEGVRENYVYMILAGQRTG
jgi:hypothetical protein